MSDSDVKQQRERFAGRIVQLVQDSRIEDARRVLLRQVELGHKENVILSLTPLSKKNAVIRDLLREITKGPQRTRTRLPIYVATALIIPLIILGIYVAVNALNQRSSTENAQVAGSNTPAPSIRAPSPAVATELTNCTIASDYLVFGELVVCLPESWVVGSSNNVFYYANSSEALSLIRNSGQIVEDTQFGGLVGVFAKGGTPNSESARAFVSESQTGIDIEGTVEVLESSGRTGAGKFGVSKSFEGVARPTSVIALEVGNFLVTAYLVGGNPESNPATLRAIVDRATFSEAVRTATQELCITLSGKTYCGDQIPTAPPPTATSTAIPTVAASDGVPLSDAYAGFVLRCDAPSGFGRRVENRENPETGQRFVRLSCEGGAITRLKGDLAPLRNGRGDLVGEGCPISPPAGYSRTSILREFSTGNRQVTIMCGLR